MWLLETKHQSSAKVANTLGHWASKSWFRNFVWDLGVYIKPVDIWIFFCHSQLTVLGVSTVLSHPSWSLVAMPTRFLEYSMCAGVLSETVQFILQVFCCLIMIRFVFLQFKDKLRVCKPVARVVFLSFSLSGTFWFSGAAPFGSNTQKAGTVFNLLFHKLL